MDTECFDRQYMGGGEVGGGGGLMRQLVGGKHQPYGSSGYCTKEEFACHTIEPGV